MTSMVVTTPFTTRGGMTIGVSSLSSILLLSLLLLSPSVSTITSAFRTTTTTTTFTNVGTIIHRPPQTKSHYYHSVGNLLRQQQQQQQNGASLLYSSTALSSPLQPVPEESSTIDNDNDETTTRTTTTTTNVGIGGDTKIQLTKQQQKLEYIRSEGGRFSFNTKYGALNPFAIYYGLTSILLGLPWFVALTCYQLIQFVTFRRFDRLRRIPVHLNQLWGESLLVFTRCFPEMIHRDRLLKFYKEYVRLSLFAHMYFYH